MLKKYRVYFGLFFALSYSNVYGIGSGGISNPSLDARSSALSNAVVAMADAPATIWFNPAGMSEIGTTFSFGSTFFQSSTKFSGQNGTSAKKDEDISATPNLYLNFKKDDQDFAWGVGLNSPFGLKTTWADDGPFKSVTTASELKLIAINPSMAYKINDLFSIGLGIDYFNVLDVSLKRAAAPTGTSEISGDGDGWGYNLGTLYKATPSHSFGFTYRSQIKVRTKGTTKLQGLSGISAAVFGSNYETPVETDLRFPPSITAGYTFRPTTGKASYSLGYEWAGWSEWDKNFLEYSETNATRRGALEASNPIQRNWKDTSNFSLGAEFKVTDRLSFQTGYFFFDQVGPDKTFNPGIPENRRNGFTLGSGYKTGSLNINIGYKAIFFKKRTITGNNSGTVNGTYETFANTLGLNLTWGFR